MKRISMVGVVASTAGSILTATTVIFSAGLAVAGPTAGTDPVGGYSPQVNPNDLDLPVCLPLFDPSQAEKKGPVTPPVDGDDPRDEPAPVFFGEEIDADKNSVIYVVDNSGSMTLWVDPFEDGGIL